MGQRILADTNCVIDYLNKRLPVNAIVLLRSIQIELSVINRIELLAWRSATLKEISILNDFVHNCILHSLDEEIILKTIEIRKNYRLKLPDAIIAATALTYNLHLYTRNLPDFKKVPGLTVTNPHTL